MARSVDLIPKPNEQRAVSHVSPRLQIGKLRMWRGDESRPEAFLDGILFRDRL